MNIVTEILSIVGYAGIGLIIGIILNSRNTIGLVNAVTNLFTQTFSQASSTIR